MFSSLQFNQSGKCGGGVMMECHLVIVQNGSAAKALFPSPVNQNILFLGPPQRLGCLKQKKLMIG
jgi:hypothetical protein